MRVLLGMTGLLQRVSGAEVAVRGVAVAAIGCGLRPQFESVEVKCVLLRKGIQKNF